MAKRKRRRKARPAPERPEAQSNEAPRQEEPAADRWRPWLLGGLVALFVLRPLFPSESAAREGDGLVVVMLWIALAVFWLLGAIGRRQFRVRFGWTGVAVLLLVGWHTIAALWATAHGSPRPAINMLWEWVAYGLCFLLARQLIVSRREARAVLAVTVALAVALAAYGLYQYYWELPATRAEFLRNPEAAMRKAEVWFEPGSREFKLFLARLDTYKPMATFGLTNSLAGFLAPWLVVTAGIGVWAGLGRKRWPTWLAVAACALPIAPCLLLTHSRTGCLAAAFGLLLLVAAFFLERRPRIGWKLPAAVASAGAILVAAVVVLGVVDNRVSSAAAKSLGYRVQYWQSTARMIADRPIAGCGPGNFRDAYTLYMLPEASEEIADPHNLFMEIWATAGTPAVLALLAVLGGFAYAMFRRGGGGLGSGEASTGSACINEGQADGTRQVIGGAACGFLLSVPIGQMSAAPPGIAVVIVGLPLASVAVILLWRWIDAGRLSVVLPAVGVVVLLVNLLAAGAMGFPGVAGTLWLLMALGLNLTDKARPHVLPRAAAVAGLGVVMALLFACWASGFNPVVRSQTAMRLALREPGHAEEHVKDAAVADPLSAEPWRELAQRAFVRWLKYPTTEALDDFETCVKTALELAPNSATTWQMCGDRYWQAFLKTGRDDTLHEAVSAYRRAVDLYPNSPVNRANLAMALRAAGDESGFREQATRALHLDKQTPHSDKKLDDAFRDELRRGLSRSSSQGGQHGILGPNGANSVRSPGSVSWVSAPVERPEPKRKAGPAPAGFVQAALGPVFISSIPNQVAVKTFAMRTWLLVGLAAVVGIGAGVGFAIARVNRYPWDGTPMGVTSDAAEAFARQSEGPAAKILLEEDTYEFKLMDSNAHGRHEFIFTNVGQGPLKLQKGATSCSCTAALLQDGIIAPGESGIVAVEWSGKGRHGDFVQTAQIETNDPNRQRVVLTVKGRVTLAVEAAPPQLLFTGVTAGEPSSGNVRVFGFLPRSLEITGREFSKPDIADYFDVTYRPLSADELAAEEEEGATSGCLVEVTVKPGLPVGAFRQTITLKTNYPESPTVELPVQGNIGSEISIVGKGWNEQVGILSLGSIRSQEGLKRQLFIRVGSPDSKEVTYKPVETYPDLIRVTLGKTTHIEGGKVALTPLIIEIPKGSRPANHMGLKEENLGRIVLETTHPKARQLRLLVRFAVEGQAGLEAGQ